MCILCSFLFQFSRYNKRTSANIQLFNLCQELNGRCRYSENLYLDDFMEDTYDEAKQQRDWDVSPSPNQKMRLGRLVSAVQERNLSDN